MVGGACCGAAAWLTEATSGGIEQLLERIKTTPPAW
jgi:hypothetical protein